jgi:predicted phosphodiesterase
MPAMLAALAIVTIAAGAPEHDWRFESSLAARGFAATGAPGHRASGFVFSPDESGAGLIFGGADDTLVVLDRRGDDPDALPRESFTVGGWVSIDTPQRWGGLIGCVRDDGDVERGWVLGYDERGFTFGLASVGADDGNGAMTYLPAGRIYDIGRWHHVVATYDGASMRLYVDGGLAGVSDAQHGPILYDDDAPFVIGAYRDTNEHHPHDGRLHDLRMLGRALSDTEIRAWHDADASRGRLAPWTDTRLGFLVEPFLTWPTTEAMSITFETTVPSHAVIEYRHESGTPRFRVESDETTTLHQVRLRDLAPNTKYFYDVIATTGRDEEVRSEARSFRTAATPDRPFTFVAIGDTQTQGDVFRRVSDLAFMHRPNLVVHAGDLVDTGTDKSQWTEYFFPNIQPLAGFVPLMPVLGNHYYDYMDLPAPESSYAFTYGNAEFFMIDGNRALGEASAQLDWLERALAASTATWRFAVLHQPPYTSDSDDYGDTTTTTSTRGDVNVQHIIALLERHGVDVCFSGHVHDYERTFPILDGRVTSYEDGGVVYVTTAGGGGRLENFDGTNTWFGHKKAQWHHLVYVAVNGGHLEFQAIDEHGRLFDVFELRKSETGRRRIDHAPDRLDAAHDHADGHVDGDGSPGR